MAEGTHVTVWFGKHDRDLLAILKQPGVNASGVIKMALRAYVEGDKPSMIAKAVVDELSSRGLFFYRTESEGCVGEELESILVAAVDQFSPSGDGESDKKSPSQC